MLHFIYIWIALEEIYLKMYTYWTAMPKNKDFQ